MYSNVTQVRKLQEGATIKMKSRSSQCNEMLLVRTAAGPSQKFGLQSTAKKLAVMVMPVPFQTDAAVTRK